MREEEKKRKSQKSGIKRLLSKRWALPAIYLASAALLLAAVLWFQDSNKDLTAPGDSAKDKTELTGKTDDTEAIEVNTKSENFAWPVAEQDQVVIKKEFYDVKGSKESQENALLQYDNKFEKSRGIDVSMKDGKSFGVLAAVSGKVTKVQEDTLLGNVIEIDHGNGITTSYQSVNDIAVKEGDKVEKGQSIAKAGQSLINPEAGVHVHFEIRKDSVAVNPVNYFEKSVTTLVEAEVFSAESSEEDKAEEAPEEDSAEQTDGSAPEEGTSEEESGESTDQNEEN
ncbi:MAG: peptidoglycan DD-metalloendopeptidase family protein [Bacillus sp. (in: firmicutes)]